MNTGRGIANTLAMLGVIVASMLPASPLKNGLVYLIAGYFLVYLCLRARSGYTRRRSHWTRESWHRYLMLCSVPAGAIVVCVCMMAAFELKLPIVGAAHSTARALWALGMMTFMVIGVGGLVVAVEWLAQGEPSRQFAWPRWPSRGPHSAAYPSVGAAERDSHE